jgi:hypothetical protein
MSNKLRIIYQNAADSATIAASTTAGSLTTANLKTDTKSEVWRSTATSATLTLTWTDAQIISGVILPYCNLTSLATIQAEGYAETADVVPLFDTGAVEACPAPVLGLWNWGSEAFGSNAFSYGGGTYGRVWIPVPGAVKKLVITLTDTTNAAGYIEAGRLVAGAHWSPSLNADYGATITWVEASTQVRTEAGDLLTDTGTKHRVMSFTLGDMPEEDRNMLNTLLVGNGMSRPLLFSLYPEDENARLEQDYQLYCKLQTPKGIGTPYFRRFSGAMDLEEI